MNHLSLVGQDVFNDLELFSSFTNDNTHTILHIFNQFKPNNGSQTHLIKTLKYPSYDIDILMNRQSNLLNIINIYKDNTSAIDSILNNITTYEKDIDWFFNRDNEEIIDILNNVFFQFKIFELLNFNNKSHLLFIKNTYTILGAPIIGLLSPFMYIIIPYIVLVYKFKFNLSITTFFKVFINTFMNNHNIRKLVIIQFITYALSLFIYIQSLVNTFDLAKSTYTVSSHIVNKVKNVINYVNSCQQLNLLFNFQSEPFDKLLSDIYKCDTTFINYGNYLVFFKNTDLTLFSQYLKNVNVFLADITFAKVFIQYNMCFSTFIKSDTTYINTKDMYHICINNSVSNNLLLDSNNCIITGPNAAGKSTFIKGLVLNIILSQTYGIATASSFDITPFYYINTQINIPDAKGKESLFEAEMHRCKHNIDIIKFLPTEHKAFIVMDEVFSSTNVVEGVAGAYGILQKMSTFPNICTIVTTHFAYLTKLPSFIKLKMNVNISNEYIITYPYLLTKGVSKQLIALELIKDNFDGDIIDTAMLIKKKLLV